MAKNKVSEWSATAANNTDIGGIDIAEGCAPSGINNAIREMMAQVKDMITGADGDNFTVGGNLSVTGTSAFTGIATFTAVPVIPATIGFVPSGVIVMWSGSIASIPSGWALCDGTNGTPDLRNRFIVGAGSTYSVAGTGGSADAIVVAHTHTGTTSTTGAHTHSLRAGIGSNWSNDETRFNLGLGQNLTTGNTNSAGDHAHTFTTNSTGSSGTGANLPPYFALAYIMKL